MSKFGYGGIVRFCIASREFVNDEGVLLMVSSPLCGEGPTVSFSG